MIMCFLSVSNGLSLAVDKKAVFYEFLEVVLIATYTTRSSAATEEPAFD